jgi:hypothetical protein
VKNARAQTVVISISPIVVIEGAALGTYVLRRMMRASARTFGVRCAAILAFAAMLLANPRTRADSRGGRAVVVELFTSQGCSTCPPADRLLAELARRDPALVPLAFHVDYWNRLGWTDPFSQHAWSERQGAYARARGTSRVYTPQAIVDGLVEITGAEEDRLGAAVAAEAERPAADIALTLRRGPSEIRVAAEVSVPTTLQAHELDLMLAVFETDLVTPVSGGENLGRTLRDSYVVRSLVRAARIAAGGSGRSTYAASLPISADWSRSHLGVAAFLQDPRSLEIAGARAER